MNWVKSGKEKSVKLVDVHDAIGRDRVIRDDGGTLKPTRLLVLGVFCNTKPHCALQISSAKMASLDHSRDNCAQSVIRSDAHWACWKFNKREIFSENQMNSVNILPRKCVNILPRMLYLRLRLYICSSYMVMGMLIGQQPLDGHQFDILELCSPSRHSYPFVALNGMELVDSYTKILHFRWVFVDFSDEMNWSL